MVSSFRGLDCESYVCLESLFLESVVAGNFREAEDRVMGDGRTESEW